jgi:hypothetical protein
MKIIKSKKIAPKSENVIKCIHCKKLIKKTQLVGFSLICPLCGMPQNGKTHFKFK